MQQIGKVWISGAARRGAEAEAKFFAKPRSGMDEFSAERIVLKENFLCKLGFLFERKGNFIFVTGGNIMKLSSRG